MSSHQITHHCGHDRTIQLARGANETILWPYRQNLCPACALARKREQQANDYTPPLVWRDGDTLIASRTYDTWRQFNRRGWWLGDLTAEPRDGAYADSTVLGKVYRLHLSAPSRWAAELAWLHEIEADFDLYHYPPADWELPTPRAFRGYDLGTGDLRDRTARAVLDIRRALRRSKRPYVAFSGGKDSSVVLRLVHLVDPRVEVIWSDDELEFPETVALQRETQERLGPLYRTTLGFAMHAGWFRPWQDEPYWREPLPGAERIDQMMEPWAQSEGYDLTFLGLRMDESKGREALLSATGPNYYRQWGAVSCPIWNWYDEMVYEFLARTGTPINAAYARYAELGIEYRRVGPLPLADRNTIASMWPSDLPRLEARYGRRWA